MVSGHWAPRWVTEEYLDMLPQEGDEQVRIHHELLPFDEFGFPADGVLARIAPYYSRVQTGTVSRFIMLSVVVSANSSR